MELSEVLLISVGLMFVSMFAITALTKKRPSGIYMLYGLAACFVVLFGSYLVSDESFIDQFGVFVVFGVATVFAVAGYSGSWLAYRNTR